MTQKAVFITGSSGGMGSATATLLADKGWHVFAADCDTDALEKFKGIPRITPFFVDITDQDLIDKAYKEVQQQVSGLDGLVNFAGIISIGSMIELDEEALHRVIDINVMGTFRVNRTFFPLVKHRKGRIINTTSEIGLQSGHPFNGAYALSKHALEAYTDSLRRELMLLDIPVIKIQPGPFRSNLTTEIPEQFAQAAKASTYFSDALANIISISQREIERSRDPIIVANVVYECLTVPRPKHAYPIKPAPQRSLLEMLPNRLIDYIMRRILQR